MSQIKLITIFVMCLIPQIAGAEFLGVKKCTEPIVFPVNGPLDTLGRQTLAFSTADHPDSITVFTYLDDGTFIAWDSGGAAYACPGIDTTMRRGEVQIWFNRKIHWIDGIPSDSNSYTLSVAVLVWEDGYYRETNATVQVVTDSLNQLYAVRDSVNLYDDATRSWGANVLKVGGDAITDNGDGRLEVNVEELADNATSLADLKDFADEGYDPANNQINANVTDWNSTLASGLLLDQDATTHYPLVHVQGIGGSIITATSLHGNAAKEISDSVWKAGIKGKQAGDADSTFADAFINTGGQAYAIVDFDTSGGTLANSQVDDDVDVNAKTVTAGAIEDGDIATGGIDWGGELDTTGFGANAQEAAADAIVAQDVMLASDTTTIPDNVWGHGTRTLTSGASFTLSAAAYGSIGDSVWAKDTSNTLWNGLLSRFGEWNASAQAVTGSNCGSGAQALTIYVLDTSGTDELVTSFVTIYNSAVTSTEAFGTAMGGIAGTYGLTASTAYKGLAIATGYYFPLYSFTTGSGASHTDTIRGYDIPTSAGSAVPSGQQVQLYDWVISPSNDTLYGAEVEITLAGSSNFYTSTHLVPPARVVVYAGVNDGSANGGKWQETLFGTDSLFTSGVDNANYTITIKHKSLKFPVVYEGLSIPASATPTRLRTILDNQD